MAKLVALGLALAGLLALLNSYAPQTWKTGFLIQGNLLPYAVIVIGLGLVVVWKAK